MSTFIAAGSAFPVVIIDGETESDFFKNSPIRLLFGIDLHTFQQRIQELLLLSIRGFIVNLVKMYQILTDGIACQFIATNVFDPLHGI